MISDRELQELFNRKALEVDIDTTMPHALTKRVRRRQGLLALTGAVAVVGFVVLAWMGLGSSSLTEAVPPARDNRNVIDTPLKGLAPTPESLAGIWRRELWEENPLLLRIGRDGTFAFDNHGQIDQGPAIPGTYEVDGDLVHFTVGSDSDACAVGDTWTFRMGIEPNGRMHTENIEDGTGVCSTGLGSQWSFVRVSPTSPASATITANASSAEGVPPSTLQMIRGIWLEVQGDDLLRVSWDTSYAVDDTGRLAGNPDDAGTIALGDKGTITLTSDAGSRTCPEGAVTIWEDVRMSAGTLRGVVTKDECTGNVGVERTWILIASE
jgi:hypothetical protein